MMRLCEFLLIVLLVGAQVIGQLHAAPNNQKLSPMVNETTTAIPLYNVSTSSTRGNSPTGTTSVPRVTAPTGNKQSPFDSISDILAQLTSTGATSKIPDSTDHQESTSNKATSYFYTTTAAPPFVRPPNVYREFDAMSFMGGALVAIILIVTGMIAWKIYEGHVERRYWTL